MNNIRIILLFTLSLLSNVAFSQFELKIYTEKIENGYKILANNDEFCPVSIKLDLTLKNMTSLQGSKNIFVIPPRTKGYLLIVLKSKKRGKYSYSYKTRYNYGNHLKKEYDKNYSYYLPLPIDKKFKISQGYNGARTHKDINALDFSMSVGTNIYAIRGGTVIKVIENNNKGCPDEICARYNNKILIYHEDGTFASYLHLIQDGAIVKKGDVVEKGQLIGKSGNTGWSSGPHLHVEVYQQWMETSTSLKTKFKINDGQKSEILKENSKYKRNYR